MPEQPLLQEEAYLLSVAWNRPDHFPAVGIASDDWHEYYETQLERTMSVWLLQGLLAWQSETRRPSAFEPVAYRIGTSRQDLGYVDSLVRLVADLVPQRDRTYRMPPFAHKEEQYEVRLGVCLANAAALAMEAIAARLPADPADAIPWVRALQDALTLVRAVQPFKAEAPLCNAWDSLFADRGRAAQLETRLGQALRHKFILAIYPLAHAGMQNQPLCELVDRIYAAGEAVFGSTGWPDVLATRAMFHPNAVVKRYPVPDPRFTAPEPLAQSPQWKKEWSIIRAPTGGSAR